MLLADAFDRMVFTFVVVILLRSICPLRYPCTQYPYSQASSNNRHRPPPLHSSTYHQVLQKYHQPY